MVADLRSQRLADHRQPDAPEGHRRRAARSSPKSTIEEDQAIVCLVGENIRYTPGVARRVFNSLDDINIRMISQGASLLNLSFVVAEARSVRTAVERCTPSSSPSSTRRCSSAMRRCMSEDRPGNRRLRQDGRLIEQLAPEYGFEVALKLDEFNNANFEGITAENFRGVDVAIEFSIRTPSSATSSAIAALGVNMVVGTTGWPEHLDRVREAVDRTGIGLVWSPNFSVGVNAFLPHRRRSRRLAGGRAEYGAWAWEIHHATKKDAPSGTLLKLVEEMKKAGYSRAIDVEFQSRRRASRARTRSVSIPPPIPSPAPRRPQPRRLRARRVEGRAMGAWEEGLS